MVAKITTPNNCQRAIDYIMAIHKEDKESKLLLHSAGVLVTDNRTIAACMEMAALLGDHDLERPFKHISLDFHKLDKERLTDDFMIKVASDYMKQMGITDTEFIIYRHLDKEHPHCHLVFSRVNRKGKILRDSNERKRNIEVCKLLNQKYALHMSEGKVAVNRNRLKGKAKQKYQLHDKVIMARDHSNDWKEFEEQLQALGVKLKFHYNNVTHKLMGVSFSDGHVSFSGKQLDNSLVYAVLAEKFGDINVLARQNVKNFYEYRREELLRLNSSNYHEAIHDHFPDFDIAYPIKQAIANMPNANSLISNQLKYGNSYMDYDVSEYIASKDANTGFLPLDLMIEVALAPYAGPIAQCGGGGSSSNLGWNDDDKDKDKWKFRFMYNRGLFGKRKRGRSI